MNKFVLFFALLFGISNLINAQSIEDIFQARDDASQYLENYQAPLLNGFMYNLNNGWYTTGKTHKKFGFDITVNLSASMIPDDAKTFHFDPADYNYLTLQGGGTADLPTVAGGTTNEVLVGTYSGDTAEFDAIDGVGEEWPDDLGIPLAIPTPMVQIGLGLPTKTDIKLRFFPKTTSNDIEYSLIGVGLQHNLSQYFKSLEAIPKLSISGLGAFTNAKMTYIDTNNEVDGSDQRMEMNINTYTAQIIGDIDLKIVDFYLGMGLTAGTTNLGVLGTYKYDTDDNGTIEPDEILTDPLNVDFSINGFKTTLGTRINLGPFKIFGDYTLQKYPSINAGIALSIR